MLTQHTARVGAQQWRALRVGVQLRTQAGAPRGSVHHQDGQLRLLPEAGRGMHVQADGGYTLPRISAEHQGLQVGCGIVERVPRRFKVLFLNSVSKLF